MPSLERIIHTLSCIGFRICRYLPRGLSNDEIIVRAIFSPYHLNKKKNELIPAAFEPSPNTDEISVMRSSFLGAHRCKALAVDLENPKVHKAYKGFAVLSVRALRAVARCGRLATRDFLGHGDIKTGMVKPPKGVPREPADLQRFQDLCATLISLSKYCADPSPSHPRWQGAPLKPK